MTPKDKTRRRLLVAGCACIALIPQGAQAQSVSTSTWDFTTDRAIEIAGFVRARSDAIAAALSAGGGDAGFVSVFGTGAGTPAQRKQKTIATARDLQQIAFDEKTQLVTAFDAFLGNPTEARWTVAKARIKGMTGRLDAVQRKLERLSGETASAADDAVNGKIELLERQATRPQTPADLAVFRRFRDAFAALVDEKARLAEQLARLGASM